MSSPFIDPPTVRLRGAGGGEWDFTLPLREAYIDQLAKGILEPADPEVGLVLGEHGEWARVEAHKHNIKQRTRRGSSA